MFVRHDLNDRILHIPAIGLSLSRLRRTRLLRLLRRDRRRGLRLFHRLGHLAPVQLLQMCPEHLRVRLHHRRLEDQLLVRLNEPCLVILERALEPIELLHRRLLGKVHGGLHGEILLRVVGSCRKRRVLQFHICECSAPVGSP